MQEKKQSISNFSTMTKAEKVAAVKQVLDKTRLDPVVVKETLGIHTDRVSPQVWLAASSKLLKIQREEAEPDDRDSLKFSDFLGPEDYIAEHIDKDAGRLQKKAITKMEQKKNLDWFHPGFFTPQVRSVTVGNSLSQNAEGVNPLEIYNVSHRVTKLGEGGLPGTEAIPSTSREVNPTSFGFFDPMQNVESTAIGVVNYFCRNVIKGKDRKLYKLVKNRKTGKQEWVSHDKLLDSKVYIPEE
jgi:DNA-directed RNA polymerase beta subunit